QRRRSDKRLLRVRQVDDEDEIGAAEERIGGLDRAAILLDQVIGLACTAGADALDSFRRIFSEHDVSGHGRPPVFRKREVIIQLPSSVVMAGHSPSKTGVNALMSRPSTFLLAAKDV